MRIYSNFEEVAKDIEENTPKIIYKYRDWENEYHKTIITKKELYFAQPHTLNDPYDVRPPYNFIVSDIDFEAVRNRLRKAGREIERGISEKQLEQEIEIRLQSIIEDPINYFKNNKMNHALDSSQFDSYGVLSFGSSSENEAMWAHYGNNHYGFAVGFNTVRLARALNCFVGIVDYDDTPMDYFIMGNNFGMLEKELFRKSTKWAYEQEIRFTTVGVGLISKRLCTFPIEAVEEIVFGLNTPQKTQYEIIEMAIKTLPGISIFKNTIKADAFGFEKIKIL